MFNKVQCSKVSAVTRVIYFFCLNFMYTAHVMQNQPDSVPNTEPVKHPSASLLCWMCAWQSPRRALPSSNCVRGKMLIAVIRAEQSCDILYIPSVTAACSLCLAACLKPFQLPLRIVNKKGCSVRPVHERQRVKEEKKSMCTAQTGHLTGSLENRYECVALCINSFLPGKRKQNNQFYTHTISHTFPTFVSTMEQAICFT